MEEGAALAALEAVTKNKAAADRAAKLDTGIAAFREKNRKAGPVLEANSQGNCAAACSICRKHKAATLSTYQTSPCDGDRAFDRYTLVASEVLEHHETKVPEARSIPAETAQATHTKPVEAASVIEAFPMTKHRKLPSTQPSPLDRITAQAVGSVVEIMADIMQPGHGKVEIADVFAAYADACDACGKKPISANEFPTAIAALCKY